MPFKDKSLVFRCSLLLGEPTASVSIRLRGVTSINASTTPLFILDGSEITSNTFKALNPEDIATMTVLKDASATAIYGSRAANGCHYPYVQER
jgi:TonB-dependent SusC/RagA subfamily outer membrane receptor